VSCFWDAGDVGETSFSRVWRLIMCIDDLKEIMITGIIVLACLDKKSAQEGDDADANKQFH
jgi:hypothetical protein